MTVKGLDIARELGLTIYDHEFGHSSERHAEGVLPSLMDVGRLAICICEYDGTILSTGGVRTRDEAIRLGFEWSRHREQSDGYGHALDLVALTPGKGVDWQNKAAFLAMAKAVKIAAAILFVTIRQGCDWDMDGILREAGEYDMPHFEDPKGAYTVSAINEMERTRRGLGLTDRTLTERVESLERGFAELRASA